MKNLIHDAPGYRLEATITCHPISGPTLELYDTWPSANHPEPHRKLSLTLPAASLIRLGRLLVAIDAQDDHSQVTFEE